MNMRKAPSQGTEHMLGIHLELQHNLLPVLLRPLRYGIPALLIRISTRAQLPGNNSSKIKNDQFRLTPKLLMKNAYTERHSLITEWLERTDFCDKHQLIILTMLINRVYNRIYICVMDNYMELL